MKNQAFKSILRCAIVFTLLLPAWLAWNVRPAQGAAINVTTLEDPLPNGCMPTDCSLREAIILANSTPEVDFIYLIAGDYYIGQPGTDDAAFVGDLDILNPVQLIGPGKDITTIYSFNGDRVFSINNTSQVAFSGLTIRAAIQPYKDGSGIHCLSSNLIFDQVNLSNFAPTSSSGGAIFSQGCAISMNYVAITGNTARYGGGIYAVSSTMTINLSSIDANYATHTGGGIFLSNTYLNLVASKVINNTGSITGGGIYFENPVTPNTLTIDASLVANNTSQGDGGGILAFSGTALNIKNSTISGNMAYTRGGGVFTSLPTYITHTTMVDNIADYDISNDGSGGGLMASGSGALVSVANSILANNDDRSANNMNDCDQVDGTVTSQGYNLVESPGLCTFSSIGDIVAQDPKLGPLQANGGPTQTHALLPGSLAINAGNPMLTRLFVVIPLFDQRGIGFPRVVNGRIDIGAFEAWIWTFLPVVFR